MQAKGQNIWPAVPGAPTIGTATATGATTATVAFTAGSTGYPSTVTFTATSSPAGGTGTGTSPITVTGLTTGTTYTFTVTATNATGTGPASAASNSVTPLPAIGAAYEGGFFAGQISTAGNSIADYNLVIGPLASTQSTLQWKTSTTGGDPTSPIDGPANSAAMNSAAYPAAQFCEGLTIGGFSDWYMPAQQELEVCYYNLKPTTDSNVTNYGINPYSVPARASNYSAGTPAQTSAATFQTGNAEAFTTGTYYWSSTQNVSTNAMTIRFGVSQPGDQYAATKTISTYRVRAVRRVAV